MRTHTHSHAHSHTHSHTYTSREFGKVYFSQMTFSMVEHSSLPGWSENVGTKK